ncbi:MAG: hypothetical protein J6J36_07505 [Clostridia bacterium]|nr:hypothetical protein [Clostridia bacterium]
MGQFFTEKKKKEILIYLILWLVLAIVLVVPASVAAIDSTYNDEFNGNTFLSIIVDYIINLEVRVKAFQEKYIANTGTAMKYYSFFYFILVIILMIKTKDSDYRDIEHGSSDWSVGGEQYKVLSRKEGIILAEKNYLPVDKKGNVNILIVGRIWCW